MLLLGFLSLGVFSWLIARQLRPAKPEQTPGRLTGSCPGCRRNVKSGWLVCPDCLTRLRESCAECGESRDRWFNFCPWCGHAAGGTNPT